MILAILVAFRIRITSFDAETGMINRFLANGSTIYQPIGSAIDPDVDVIACIAFQIQFLGRQITVAIDHQLEEQVIHIFPWITDHDFFKNHIIYYLTSLFSKPSSSWLKRKCQTNPSGWCPANDKSN